mgnify:CR=1 FL=1
MKKVVSLILIICSAFCLFVACGNPNKTIEQVQNRYQEMVNTYKKENVEYFGDTSANLSKTIVIKFNEAEVRAKISSENSDDVSLRFRALNDIQANLLKYIFRYYENWNESFYNNLKNYDYEQKELNTLFEKIENLDKALATFKEIKNTFEADVVMLNVEGSEIAIVNQFVYQYNKVIEKSIDFVDYFRAFHLKTIFDGEAKITNVNSAQRLLDEAYLNLAKYIYYSNIDVYNYSIGNKGICDQLDLMKNKSNKFVFINSLSLGLSNLGANITNELCQTIFDDELTNKLSNIDSNSSLFKQSLNIYLSLKDELYYYTLLRVELGLIEGISINDYVANFGISESVAYQNRMYMVDFLYPEYLSLINELLN